MARRQVRRGTVAARDARRTGAASPVSGAAPDCALRADAAQATPPTRYALNRITFLCSLPDDCVSIDWEPLTSESVQERLQPRQSEATTSEHTRQENTQQSGHKTDTFNLVESKRISLWQVVQ
jgi:hypothetical protein